MGAAFPQVATNWVGGEPEILRILVIERPAYCSAEVSFITLST